MITLTVIGVSMSLKIPIYNFFHNMFVGEMFFDPSGYKTGEYGFNENPGKSEKLFKKGYQKLVKLASETYKIEYSDPMLSEKFNHEDSWESLASEDSLKLVYMLFHDMELFCVPFVGENDPDLTENEKLKKRYNVNRKSDNEGLQFAIKDDEFTKYANLILDIDQNYFYLSQQKKPDSIPALKMREKLLRAVCKPQNISVEMTRALEYREYKTEKEVYLHFKGGNPDFIADETYNNLRKDKLYGILLKEQFQNTFFVTQNIHDRLQQSYNYYILKHDDFYLENYIQSALEYSRNSGVRQNENIFAKLLSLMNEKNKSNKTLLYALAEVGFRLHKYDESREYLDKLSLLSKLAGADFYKVKRLYFLLELVNEG
jgi:hypothetical protein